MAGMDVPAMAVCIADAAARYGASTDEVAALVVNRGGRPGEIRKLADGTIEVGLARIPGHEIHALARNGITVDALANDTCLNIAIATYLHRRDQLAAAPAATQTVAVRPARQTPAVAPKSHEAACLAQAAQRYHLPAPVLQAVVLTEGGWEGLKKRNKNGSYDLGPAQINTIHLQELSRFGVSEQQLRYDVCVNLHVAAYRLRFEINRVEDFWRGVGNYHSRTPSKSERYKAKVLANLKRITGGGA